MAGYNGLGISKKLIAQDSTEKIYEVKPEDLLYGYEFHLREDVLNHTILVRSSVTNNYMSVFMPIAMGNDGDFIKFKLYDDLENVNGDTPYVDFWGEDWNEDIDTRYLGTANVDSTDGYYWIAENNNEAYFLKKDGKWTIVRDKGLFDIGEWKNPKFGDLNLRNIIADSYLSIKVNDTYVANFNWDKLTIDTSIRLRGHIESLTHITQQDHPSIGIPDYPFGDLHLVGNAHAADPTEENHLATKKYVDENGGNVKNYQVDSVFQLENFDDVQTLTGGMWHLIQNFNGKLMFSAAMDEATMKAMDTFDPANKETIYVPTSYQTSFVEKVEIRCVNTGDIRTDLDMIVKGYEGWGSLWDDTNLTKLNRKLSGYGNELSFQRMVENPDWMATNYPLSDYYMGDNTSIIHHSGYNLPFDKYLHHFFIKPAVDITGIEKIRMIIQIKQVSKANIGYNDIY